MGDISEFGRDQSIESRARRLGLGEARSRDALTDYSITMLKTFTAQLEQALEDEGVEWSVARKVVSRVVQGCLPHPVDAQVRIEMRGSHIEDLRRGAAVANGPRHFGASPSEMHD